MNGLGNHPERIHNRDDQVWVFRRPDYEDPELTILGASRQVFGVSVVQPILSSVLKTSPSGVSARKSIW